MHPSLRHFLKSDRDGCCFFLHIFMLIFVFAAILCNRFYRVSKQIGDNLIAAICRMQTIVGKGSCLGRIRIFICSRIKWQTYILRIRKVLVYTILFTRLNRITLSWVKPDLRFRSTVVIPSKRHASSSWLASTDNSIPFFPL